MALRPPAVTQLMRAAFYSNHYQVHVDCPLEKVMCDEYWVHEWKKIKANDVITAIANDGSYDVDFRVTSIIPNGNNTPRFAFKLIREAPAARQAETVLPVIPSTPRGSNDRYEVKKGWAGKWRVIDQMTGNVMCDGVAKDVAEAEKLKLETPQAQAA